MGFLRNPPRAFVVTWDVIMVVLAVESMILVVQFEQADAALRDLILLADYALVAVFVVDFAWDTYRAEDRTRFLRRNWWAILGMVPLAWTQLDYLRLLRITRALRILRTFGGLARMLGNAQDAAEKSHIGRLALVSGAIMIVGSIVVWFVERDANLRFQDYGEALWWSVVTVTTVGYGDITPQTTVGRIVASALMVTGIGTIGLLAGQVGSHLVGVKGQGRDLVTDLERLSKLHEKGRIDAEEFAKAKARLLGK